MKTCTWCALAKAEEEFAFRNKARGTRRAQCKLCVREWDRNHYKTSPDRARKIRDTAAVRRKENMEYVRTYLRKHPCVDCFESDIRCLDFDHLYGKISNVTMLARNGVSLQKIREEIAKCEVRCANCHRKKTYDRAGWTYASEVLMDTR